MSYVRVAAWNAEHPPGTPVLAWPGTKDREPLRTRTRSSAWLLGGGEPVVMVAGCPGGIHLDHIEHDPTRQPAVPDIEFEPPPCPICRDALDTDGDSFVCLGCRASWSMSGDAGSWDDPAAPRCPATCRPLPNHLPDLAEQCVLAEDHDPATHRTADGITTWDDRTPQALVDSYGEPVR